MDRAGGGSLRSPTLAWIDIRTMLLPDRMTPVHGTAMGDARGHHSGFTLIEVMVALVVTLIAMDVLFGGIVASLSAAHRTAALENAISRAESHLAALGDQSLVIGERRGDDGDGYSWRTRVRFVRAVPAPVNARPGPWSRGTGLYAVSVTIFWREGRSERSFGLDSARLGPAPGASS